MGFWETLFGGGKWDSKEWGQGDLEKWGWLDYNPDQASNLLLSNAAQMINRRRGGANAKASQFGLDPVSSCMAASSGAAAFMPASMASATPMRGSVS